MSHQNLRTLRSVRSTAFNNEVAAELLRELAPLIANQELNRRMRCAARQLLLDAEALEDAYQQMNERQH
ncbi:hypothetical protein BWR15_30520 [Pseudomonas sp. T]|uniref:hypothetical protein n=1 Tax=Pseudomonas sp. PDM19 TaxID=2769272 RepID=UPI0009D9156D|nr:hypothetical protein [Pseudomonas sp. PDM19]MBD9629275.1 hypothetical protein [Pseudomonas sp. PDM19]OQR27458.1 hypothetical protein BWR15_30520 [Pseudomonas sp. T]